jgi:hypothetical protein
MGRSHVRRRRREQQPLRRLRASVLEQFDRVCSDLGRPWDEGERDTLVAEVVAAANPYMFSDRDAPIPAKREDLMYAYLTLRLLGVLRTQQEVNDYLRRTAPCPDDDFAPGVRPWAHPTSDQVRDAYAAQRRRQHRSRSEGVPQKTS